MTAAAGYGALLGIAVVVLGRVMPSPTAWLIVWIMVSLQLLWFAVVCWRRTGLPFMTAGVLAGATMSLCLTVLAALGRPYPDLPLQAWVLLGGGMTLGPLCFAIESRVNREKWHALKQHMEDRTVWDMLMMRHIPRLRTDAAGRNRTEFGSVHRQG